MAIRESLPEIQPKEASPHSPFKVGIVGLGKMGQLRAACTLNHPLLELVCGCDQDPLKAPLIKTSFVTDYRQLLEQELDIVFVCSYNSASPQIVVDALGAGKHVFCEKPPGRNIHDILAIAQAEKRNPHLKLQFGFNHRYHYAIQEAQSLIRSRLYGRILWMRGVYGKSGGLNFGGEWRSNPEIAGGGILLDQGIHMLDLFHYLMGSFSELKSITTTSYWDIPVEDNAFLILKREDDTIAFLHSSATQWRHHFSLEICLEKALLSIGGLLTSTRSYGEESLTIAKRQFEDESSAVGRPEEEKVFFDQDDSWKLEVAEFVTAIREDRPIVNGNSDDALAVMRIIDQVYRGEDGPIR